MSRHELYNDAAQTCSECFASIHHYVLVDGVVYCEDDAPADFTEETWLKFDSDDDEEASHEANVTQDGAGRYVVGWSHVDVGLVTEVVFDALEDAHYWLEDGGYIDFTA